MIERTPLAAVESLRTGPVVGLCGWSGSGKTTLLERALPRLRDGGLRVAVMKHDAHGLTIDKEGKDSDRLYRAGGNLVVQGPDEVLARLHHPTTPFPGGVLEVLMGGHDLVLLEGHKGTPVEKVWVLGPEETVAPAGVGGILLTLPWDAARLDAFLDCVDQQLERVHARRRRRAAVLIGAGRAAGEATRMNVRLLEAQRMEVVLVGSGAVPDDLSCYPRLMDAPGVESPLGATLAAMRWDPTVTWFVSPRGEQVLEEEDIASLLEQREPGTWAVIRTRQDAPAEPRVGVYEPQARILLEEHLRSGSPAAVPLGHHPKVRLVGP